MCPAPQINRLSRIQDLYRNFCTLLASTLTWHIYKVTQFQPKSTPLKANQYQIYHKSII